MEVVRYWISGLIIQCGIEMNKILTYNVLILVGRLLQFKYKQRSTLGLDNKYRKWLPNSYQLNMCKWHWFVNGSHCIPTGRVLLFILLYDVSSSLMTEMYWLDFEPNMFTMVSHKYLGD